VPLEIPDVGTVIEKTPSEFAEQPGAGSGQPAGKLGGIVSEGRFSTPA